MFKKVLVVVLMLSLLAGAVALGVHLLHRDALAVNTFFAMEIDWVDEATMYDTEIEVVVRTRTELGGLLDEEPMFCTSTDGAESTWKAEFEPNSQSVIWEVEIFSDFEWNPDPPRVDGDDVIFYVENHLDGGFIFLGE